MTKPNVAAKVAMPLAYSVLTIPPHSQPRGSHVTTWITSRSSLVVVRVACVNRAGAHLVRFGDFARADVMCNARIDLRKKFVIYELAKLFELHKDLAV